jgi:hypothetical protein
MRELKSISVAAHYERRGRAAVIDSRYRRDQLSFLFGTRGFSAAVAPGKFLDAPSRIHELLFTGEKRMTSSANTDLNIAARGASVIRRTACAHHIGLVILWMNTGFHLWKGAQNLLVQSALRKR